uniref:Uncharacterized protein n=1 Tax=Salmonella sp. TaxID=599 RepID=A0A3G2C9R4_SALSP|nr:hypothetical protein GPNKGMII_00133 [Salmonella sp.]AYM49382.1 hypothetical protein GPNKGMII_00266 [Salmonella sp.]
MHVKHQQMLRNGDRILHMKQLISLLYCSTYRYPYRKYIMWCRGIFSIWISNLIERYTRRNATCLMLVFVPFA